MKYFFYNNIKININPLIKQTSSTGRQFILVGCESDLTKTNFKFSYYWYHFKYTDKTEFINQLGEKYLDNERFSFYFENEKLQYIIKDKRLYNK